MKHNEKDTNRDRPLDTLVTFETSLASTGSAPAPVRYAVRQVLDQEYQKNIIVRENAARQARYKAGNPHDDSEAVLHDKENPIYHVSDKISEVKKDFFGRVVRDVRPLMEIDGNAEAEGKKGREDVQIWVSYHEGFSNAVRKPITVEELLRGL
jgi:chromosome transmission fidelity protein 18